MSLVASSGLGPAAQVQKAGAQGLLRGGLGRPQEVTCLVL